MRTAIYVLAPSTVAIGTVQPQLTPAVLYRYHRGAGQPALGTHRLDPGIYMIVSTGEVEVTGANLTVATLRAGKDLPPDPRPALGFEPGATTDTVHTFFQVAPRLPARQGMSDDDDAAYLHASGGSHDDEDDE